MREPIAQAAIPIASVFFTNDPSSPVPVREQNLDANGNLKVHEQGTTNVSVDGVVTTQAALPANSFTLFRNYLGGGIQDLDGCDRSLPAGTRWYISSFSALSFSTSGSAVGFSLTREGTSLHEEVARGPLLKVPAGETTQLTFPQPLVLVAPVSGACLKSVVIGEDIHLIVVGYRE